MSGNMAHRMNDGYIMRSMGDREVGRGRCELGLWVYCNMFINNANERGRSGERGGGVGCAA